MSRRPGNREAVSPTKDLSSPAQHLGEGPLDRTCGFHPGRLGCWVRSSKAPTSPAVEGKGAPDLAPSVHRAEKPPLSHSGPRDSQLCPGADWKTDLSSWPLPCHPRPPRPCPASPQTVPEGLLRATASRSPGLTVCPAHQVRAPDSCLSLSPLHGGSADLGTSPLAPVPTEQVKTLAVIDSQDTLEPRTESTTSRATHVRLWSGWRV